MTIGELAGRFGLAPHVLRHWETMGLLTPGRRPNGRRYYQRKHADQVAVILLGKEAGFTLGQLRALLVDQDDPAARRKLLAEQQGVLRRRMSDTRTSLAIISRALDCDDPDFTECAELMKWVNTVIAPPEHSAIVRGPDSSA